MGMAKQSSPEPVSEPVPVLLTRPEPDATIFAGLLTAQLGARVRPLLAPLMAVKYLTPLIPAGPFAAVIFTSSAGVAAADRLDDSLPTKAWCVGSKTASQASAAGWDATAAGSDAGGLVATLLQVRPEGRLLHLRGEDTRGEVVERLNLAGLVTDSAVVYRQVAQTLTPDAMELLLEAGVVIVPLFSPRSAWLLSQALPPDCAATLRLICMSAAVAEAAADIGGSITVAGRPDAEAMVEAVARALV